MFSTELALRPCLDYRWCGPLFFPLFGSVSFPGTCFSPRCRRLPGPAQLREVRDGRGLWPRPAAGGVSSAEQSWLTARAHPWPWMPAGHMVWNARGISPRSPSPTPPEPLSGFARWPAATQRAGRSGDLGPGSAGNRQTEGYIWGRKRVCECDKSLQ